MSSKMGACQVQAEAELDFKGCKVRLLSPTQSVMDRLAAYFHWNDLQYFFKAVKNKSIGLKILGRVITLFINHMIE